MRQLSQSLAANLAVLDKMFGTSADYYAKEITIYHCRGSILLFDGMASLDSLWELLLDAASRQAPPQQAGQRCTGPQVFELILHGSAFPAESEPVTDLADLIKRMTAGMAVLLLDGCAKGIAFSVQGLKFRSVDEPSGEGNLRGSREGFADLLRVNLSLLRRLIRTEHLVQEVAQADTEMQTEYAICYCKNKADSSMVIRVRKALAAAKPELLLDSSYFVPWLLSGKARLFTPVSYTERPAVAAAKICEGKIVVLASGRPTYGVMPLAEELHLEDYGGYILSFNGGIIMNCKTKEVVFSRQIPAESNGKIIDLAQEHNVSILTYENRTLLTNRPEDQYVQLESRINTLKIIPMTIEELKAHVTFSVPKFLMTDDGDYLAMVEPKVKAALGKNFSVYRSDPFFLEILPKGIDKAQSLERLLAVIGVKREEMIACGDGYNDLTMVQYAGLGVAMGNGVLPVRKAADYITLTNEEDGVAHVVEKFMLS